MAQMASHIYPKEKPYNIGKSMAKLGFTKASRLLGPSQFNPVFQEANYKLSSATVLILARKSSMTRLGVVVAKKNIKSAVQRNRIKRLIRESFRLRKQEFDTIDLVVLVRRGLDQMENLEILNQLNKLFDDLLRKQTTRK